MNGFSITKQTSLLLIALGFFAFVIYIDWFAAPPTLRFFGETQIDKVAHLLGGVLLALVVEWRFRKPRLVHFLLPLAIIAVGWEILEFFFDSETMFFYSISPNVWVLDSIGDIVAAFLGGYGYWVFLFRRSR